MGCTQRSGKVVAGERSKSQEEDCTGHGFAAAATK